MRWPIFLALALAAVPPSTLPLRLLGVVVDKESPARSACLIHCTYPEEKSARFQAGDRACDIAQINEVRTDAVLTTNLLTGRAEILRFADDGPSAAARPEPAPPVVTVSGDNVTVAASPDSVNHYLGNLSELLGSALATPRLLARPDGTRAMDGYEITQVRKGGLADQVGLRDGDIVLDVNGRRLDSLATAISLLGQVSNAREVKISVMRKERKLTFVLLTRGDRR